MAHSRKAKPTNEFPCIQGCRWWALLICESEGAAVRPAQTVASTDEARIVPRCPSSSLPDRNGTSPADLLSPVIACAADQARGRLGADLSEGREHTGVGVGGQDDADVAQKRLYRLQVVARGQR